MESKTEPLDLYYEIDVRTADLQSVREKGIQVVLLLSKSVDINDILRRSRSDVAYFKGGMEAAAALSALGNERQIMLMAESISEVPKVVLMDTAKKRDEYRPLIKILNAWRKRANPEAEPVIELDYMETGRASDILARNFSPKR